MKFCVNNQIEIPTHQIEIPPVWYVKVEIPTHQIEIPPVCGVQI